MSNDVKYAQTKESIKLLMKQLEKMQTDIKMVEGFLEQDPQNKQLMDRLGQTKWHMKNAMKVLEETEAIYNTEIKKQ